jgi:DNA-binding response OmpR family regulator
MTRVLVADDSETILLLLRTRLELAGYDVDTAADGQEATDLVVSGPHGQHDLFLFDAMMPRKSGIDALRELRSEGVDTPALIVSAHQDPSDADAAPSELEISGYVTKPIDFDHLLGSIEELTRS